MAPKKQSIYTNIEKVDRNQKMVNYIDGKEDGVAHSFRQAAKKFKLSSVGTVHAIYHRVKEKNKIAFKIIQKRKVEAWERNGRPIAASSQDD